MRGAPRGPHLDPERKKARERFERHTVEVRHGSGEGVHVPCVPIGEGDRPTGDRRLARDLDLPFGGVEDNVVAVAVPRDDLRAHAGVNERGPRRLDRFLDLVFERILRRCRDTLAGIPQQVNEPLRIRLVFHQAVDAEVAARPRKLHQELDIDDPTKWMSLGRGAYDWGYDYAPTPHVNGRTIGIPRGKVLGGSSAIRPSRRNLIQIFSTLTLCIKSGMLG